MLENPQDESVVRWGNEGDSFVVLEVRGGGLASETCSAEDGELIGDAEREIHQAHPPETLQAQQLCQFRPATEQVRLSQSAA
jgi:osomolarity two-component system response regulator SKN7